VQNCMYHPNPNFVFTNYAHWFYCIQAYLGFGKN
jgi:hypothetical protein